MTDGQVLEFTSVTKRFNEVTAVSDFSARIEPGAVTAFLGPNGAGKTTTLRMLLGQVRPTSGTATIGGTAFADLRQPLRVIGSVLEETVYRTRRTANRQLTIAAKANDIPLARVAEVLAIVGLENEGDSRIGGFSLGMRQRLSVAHALLGDPGALVFDEPANGLDPEGIRWMRMLMRRLADEGRTVLVSSHVLSEVEQVADNVLVLSKGQLVLASGIEELADPSSGAVVVDAPDRVALTSALATAGFDIEILRSGLTVRGSDARRVGAVAAEAGIALTTLVQRGPTLEDVFMQLVRGGKLEPRAEIVASQLVPPTSASAETPAQTADDEAAVAAAAIAADVAAAVPGGPVAAAVVAAGAGTAIAHDGEEHVGDSADNSSTDAGTTGADTDTATADAAAESAAAEPVVDDVDASGEASSGPSFDDILFGAAPAHSDEAPSVFPDADGSAPDETAADASGIEVFDDLGSSDAPAGDTDDTDGSDGDAPEHDASEGDDPRSAAVSSMLADAARAYFEDEPKDYPLADAPAEGDDDRTRVIEVVDAPSDASAQESTDGHEQNHEHNGERDHENHEHDGEQNYENHEHHEHHEGDHSHN